MSDREFATLWFLLTFSLGGPLTLGFSASFGSGHLFTWGVHQLWDPLPGPFKLVVALFMVYNVNALQMPCMGFWRKKQCHP